MTTHDHFDCIIIGPHEIDFPIVESKLKKMGEQSAAYRVLKANSVSFRGERMPYFQMLNQLLTTATGQPSHLHVCELPSLALCHLKSFLSKQQLNVEIINFFPFEKARLLSLLAQSPIAVAITTTFYVDSDTVIEIVRFIREHNPYTKIIVGGPYILNVCTTYDTEAQNFIFKTIGADIYIGDSQGELTLSQLLHELRNTHNQNLNRVPNLTYTFNNTTFQRTPRLIENNNINESIVDWQLFDQAYYTPTVQMRTARSCSFSCAFCQYPSLGGPLSLNSMDVIEHQLRLFQEAGVKNVVFIDDTFNVPLPRFKAICRMIIKNKFDFNWFSFFRCANSDDEAFDLMQASGCKGVFLGIESGDDTILTNMHKSASINRYRRGISKLRERDIITFASFIVGFPGETQETIKNTIDFITETEPTFYRAELYYHYTSVPIHQQAEQYGIRGSGYHWKHNTMDWQEACDMVDVMYKTITGPLIMPGYMFDFWSIPYLMGKGLSPDQLTRFMRVARDALVQSL